MKRILGIDTGTNSLGWAIVEKEGDVYRLIQRETKDIQRSQVERQGCNSCGLM